MVALNAATTDATATTITRTTAIIEPMTNAASRNPISADANNNADTTLLAPQNLPAGGRAPGGFVRLEERRIWKRPMMNWFWVSNRLIIADDRIVKLRAQTLNS